MRSIIALFSFMLPFVCSHANPIPAFKPGLNSVDIPIAGNTFSSQHDERNITNDGIEHWSDKNSAFTTYVRVTQTGTLKVWLHLKVPEGKSRLRIEINHKTKDVDAEGMQAKDYYVGEWHIKDTGYIAFHIKGLSKTGDVFANIDSLELSGNVINSQTAFVKNNHGNFYYWGRRGPSVHLNYQVPENTNVAWFYTEITVPKGNDVLGSYFEADGFGEGYFGMQVNSPTTRHILFSVWSPFNTQNPKDIPDSLKIQLVKKGTEVHAGEFGDEGAGGQSYLNYMWKAGETYKFLLHCQPQDNDHTIFTAYFYAPEENKWLLIASFSRPKTHTYLKGLYSFLENFDPQQGAIKRMAFYGNQWVCTDKGQWIELDKAMFTTDNTGNIGYRMDYAGGVKGDKFYLQNCGFFSHYVPSRTMLERVPTGNKPDMDLNKLP